MIKESELIDAIADCHGTRNPNANTCIKLASYYTILDHISKVSEPYEKGYSYDPPDEYASDTEFGRAIRGMETKHVLATIDELMETLRIFQPVLYDAFIGKLTVG